jgi:hypothetical protein
MVFFFLGGGGGGGGGGDESTTEKGKDTGEGSFAPFPKTRPFRWRL